MDGHGDAIIAMIYWRPLRAHTKLEHKASLSERVCDLLATAVYTTSHSVRGLSQQLPAEWIRC